VADAQETWVTCCETLASVQLEAVVAAGVVVENR
jgi:hypothetical protein